MSDAPLEYLPPAVAAARLRREVAILSQSCCFSVGTQPNSLGYWIGTVSANKALGHAGLGVVPRVDQRSLYAETGPET
jgi:hypothetical protein